MNVTSLSFTLPSMSELPSAGHVLGLIGKNLLVAVCINEIYGNTVINLLVLTNLSPRTCNFLATIITVGVVGGTIGFLGTPVQELIPGFVLGGILALILGKDAAKPDQFLIDIADCVLFGKKNSLQKSDPLQSQKCQSP